MGDFEIIPSRSTCQQCPKNCKIEDLIKDYATTGTTLQIKQAPERAKIAKTLNKNDAEFQAEKRSPYEYFLVQYKGNRRTAALDNEIRHLPLGLDFICNELQAGNIRVLADVKVEITVPTSTPLVPTFDIYQHTLRLLPADLKARLIRKEQWPADHIDKFQKPMPDVGSATTEYLAKIEEQNIDKHLFNELEETLRLFVEEPPSKWKEEFQALINAIEKLAKEDAAHETPTEEERLAQAADKLLGPMVENPRGV